MIDMEKYADGSELFDGHYKLLRPLNTDGASADVWLAEDVNTVDEPLPDGEETGPAVENTAMQVAIKVYRPKNALDIEGEQRFRDEYKIVYDCRHTNLLQPTSFSIFEGIPYLVLPYCRSGSSEHLIGKISGEKEIWKYISDVASGLHYLHTNNPPIIHQDIKPANILIDNNNNFAITDFGISVKRSGASGSSHNEENSGTLAYMAPERFVGAMEPMWQSDIWAFGATLYEILTGRVPFGEEGGQAQIDTPGELLPIENGSADINRLIRACLSKDPKDRPSAAQLIEAARSKRFPTKRISGRIRLLLCLPVVIAALAVPLLKLLMRPAGQSPEEAFTEAMIWMNGQSTDSVRIGIERLEILSAADHIPALYETAYTYGWYSDSISVRRKRLLNITMHDDPDKRYMPVSFEYNNKAAMLFSRIIELNDPAYPGITANAMYRLACYFVNANEVYNRNYIRAKDLLERALDLSAGTGDTILTRRATHALRLLNEAIGYQRAYADSEP